MAAPKDPPTTILVVDDDEFIRVFARDALEERGHRVIEAADADEGLQMAREQRPRLVLLDLLMPERSGLEILPRLLRECPECVVVVVSSVEVEGVVRQALTAGARAFVPKPFHPLELAAAVERALAEEA